ncbi:hypothetical protein B0H67DRAFT_641075 [Lasiosphaeris hirsuta]|uniref:Uncharacterized protein n=1 Tax=Lasiosphaeris hirsuta TaxID=260670 RepID=A0AA40AYZ0_9PEZI|nr:hypothetical protein B0H67DRAFT_641075 [Lasiosphaeris hirsuta]
MPKKLLGSCYLLPRDKFNANISDVAGTDKIPEVLRSIKKLCLAEITLHDAADLVAVNFGAPFLYPGHLSDGWINREEPLVTSGDRQHVVRGDISWLEYEGGETLALAEIQNLLEIVLTADMILTSPETSCQSGSVYP